jgi:hypothetical protein
MGYATLSSDRVTTDRIAFPAHRGCNRAALMSRLRLYLRGKGLRRIDARTSDTDGRAAPAWTGPHMGCRCVRGRSRQSRESMRSGLSWVRLRLVWKRTPPAEFVNEYMRLCVGGLASGKTANSLRTAPLSAQYQRLKSSLTANCQTLGMKAQNHRQLECHGAGRNLTSGPVTALDGRFLKLWQC